MTEKAPTHLENTIAIRNRMLNVLSGMDNCMDETTQNEPWSTREIIYHLSDTPAGGLGALFQGMISNSVLEFDLTPDLTNVTSERQKSTLQDGVADLISILDQIESVVSEATLKSLEETTVICHHLSRETDEVRSLENLLRGLFARHWIAHLEQLELLKCELGK